MLLSQMYQQNYKWRGAQVTNPCFHSFLYLPCFLANGQIETDRGAMLILS